MRVLFSALLFVVSGMVSAHALESAIGVENSVIYRSPVALRVKKLEKKSPVWLRIIESKLSDDAYVYHLGCIGNEEGTFDVAAFLEAENGSTADGLVPELVTFTSALPPEHLAGVSQVPFLRVPSFGYARLALSAIALLWLALPIWLVGRWIVRKATRAKPVVEEQVQAIDLLLPLLRRGADDRLDSSELALIERLLNAHLASHPDDVGVTSRRRALETYLYQKNAFDQRKVLALAQELVDVGAECQGAEATS